MRQSRLSLILTAGAASLLAGCGSTYSLKEFSPVEGQPKTAFIDIKQRAVLSAKRPTGSTNAGDLVMCAEPSPDAISSLASELGVDAKYKDSAAATLGFARQESAAFVGLRTQTIQLLRDGMYRLCEGYMSGALSPESYAWLSRRYQRNMVALLSIEQLTQVVRPPAVALTSEGAASAAKSMTAIQTEIEAIDKTKLRLSDEKTKIDAELAEAQKLPDTDKDKASKVKEVQTRLDAKKAAIAQADDLRAALLKGLENAKGIVVSGSTAAQIVAINDARASVSDTVATKITELASKVLEQDDIPTLCFLLISSKRTPNSIDAAMDKLLTTCVDLVQSGIARELNKAGEKQSNVDLGSRFLDLHVEFPQLVDGPVTQLPAPERPAKLAPKVAPTKKETGK